MHTDERRRQLSVTQLTRTRVAGLQLAVTRGDASRVVGTGGNGAMCVPRSGSCEHTAAGTPLPGPSSYPQSRSRTHQVPLHAVVWWLVWGDLTPSFRRVLMAYWKIRIAHGAAGCKHV